jgi:thioredoxin-like negative regulator of GroEL
MKVSDWIGKAGVADLVSSPKPEIVLFAAHWCGFCTRFIALAKGYQPSTEFELKLVDTDDSDESLWDTYSISIVPTIVIFMNGKQIFRRDGVSFSGLKKGDLEAALLAATSAAR